MSDIEITRAHMHRHTGRPNGERNKGNSRAVDANETNFEDVLTHKRQNTKLFLLALVFLPSIVVGGDGGAAVLGHVIWSLYAQPPRPTTISERFALGTRAFCYCIVVFTTNV